MLSLTADRGVYQKRVLGASGLQSGEWEAWFVVGKSPVSRLISSVPAFHHPKIPHGPPRRDSPHIKVRSWCEQDYQKFWCSSDYNLRSRFASSLRSRSILSRAKAVNVLLLSMPDYFEHMPPVAVRMPNGALTSLAGNIDPHHRVAVADLILVHDRVRQTVTELVRTYDPEILGLSVMTFQRRTAGRLIELARAMKPGLKVVVGGYDPSLAVQPYTEMGVDYIVRGEGEITFRDLLRALEGKAALEH